MLNNLKAFVLGVKDGWNQPFELTSSFNVDHLVDDDDFGDSVYESLDRGINFGQFIRAGRASQAWTEGYSIPLIRRGESSD